MLSFTCLDSISEAGGSRLNEDALGWSSRAAWVIDGATTLGSDTRSVSSGRLFAQTVSTLLADTADGDTSVQSWIPQVLATAHERFLNAGESDLAAAASASAAAAIVRLGSAFLEYSLFGDCVVCIWRRDSIVEHRDSRLDDLDDIAIAQLARKLRAGETLEEARSSIRGILEEHRDMLNAPTGYPSLTLDGAGLAMAKNSESRVQAGDRVLLVSDGMSDVVDLFKIVTWQDLIRQTVSLTDALSEMRAVETKDSNLLRYPRLKTADDASAILLEIVE